MHVASVTTECTLSTYNFILFIRCCLVFLLFIFHYFATAVLFHVYISSSVNAVVVVMNKNKSNGQ